jgi:hypothetical protein
MDVIAGKHAIHFAGTVVIDVPSFALFAAKRC